MEQSLDQVLSGEAVEEITETPQPEEAGDKQDSTPESTQDDESWTKAAVIDERRKRQQEQAENERLRRELEAAKSQKPQEERPDVFEDPDGAFKHFENQLNSRLVEDRVLMSQEMMRMTKDDYDEMETIFVDLQQKDPNLTQKLIGHAMPAKFIYETAKQHQQYEEMKDIDSYKAKIKEELRQELLAEQKPEAPKREPLPPSLSNVRSSSPGITEQPGKESLADILGR